MVNSEYLKNLNKAQKDAVMHLDGPLLIVAGAGSGKTKVLTSRVVHIIKEKKAWPNQILCVTFTNKASSTPSSITFDVLMGCVFAFFKISFKTKLSPLVVCNFFLCNYIIGCLCP